MTIVRLGRGAQGGGARLINLFGAGGSGKTRAAAACCRARPDIYGERAIYVPIDPGSEGLGPVLAEDRGRLELVGVDPSKDVFSQAVEIIQHPWAEEGIKTIVWDTMTTLGQIMLGQLANSGKFSSDKHIELSTVRGAKVNLPMQGDFLAIEALLFQLLSLMRGSNVNHLAIFHELEIRPEPGTPGEPYGGPAFVGKAMTRKIGNWYTQSLRFSTRQRRRANLQEAPKQEWVVHTEDRGIWKSKFRLPQPENPCPEIVLNPDPANLWQTLESYLNPEVQK